MPFRFTRPQGARSALIEQRVDFVLIVAFAGKLGAAQQRLVAGYVLFVGHRTLFFFRDGDTVGAQQLGNPVFNVRQRSDDFLDTLAGDVLE